MVVTTSLVVTVHRVDRQAEFRITTGGCGPVGSPTLLVIAYLIVSQVASQYLGELVGWSERSLGHYEVESAGVYSVRDCVLSGPSCESEGEAVGHIRLVGVGQRTAIGEGQEG